jgi:hypothetical protein
MEDFKALKTWEDICQVKKINPVESLPFAEPIDDMQEGVNAFFKIATIREVLNGGKDADWNNPSESKWFPWPDVIEDKSKPSGFGLSYYAYGIAFTCTCVGSRLLFNSKEKAKHAFIHFQSVYEKFMLITKNKK